MINVDLNEMGLLILDSNKDPSDEFNWETDLRPMYDDLSHINDVCLDGLNEPWNDDASKDGLDPYDDNPWDLECDNWPGENWESLLDTLAETYVYERPPLIYVPGDPNFEKHQPEECFWRDLSAADLHRELIAEGARSFMYPYD